MTHNKICSAVSWDSLRRHLLLFPLILCCSCQVGNVGTGDNPSGDTSIDDHSNDNSVDNSQHGISSCTQGSSLVCHREGPNEYTQTEECINVNGDPVVLAGPEPIDPDDIKDACPEPEEETVIVADPSDDDFVVTDGGGLDQQT
jgi:hypothetical protein